MTKTQDNPVIAGYLSDTVGWPHDPEDEDTPEERWLGYIESKDIGFDYTPAQADEAVQFLKSRLDN